MLNSYLGKISEGSDMEKTEIVTSVEGLYHLLKDTDKIVVTNNTFVNVVIAAFMTY